MLSLWFPEFHDLVDPLLILLAAMALDTLIGDPKLLYDRIPHPVKLIGYLVGALEKRLNDPDRSTATRLSRGMATLVIVVALSIAIGWGISYWLRGFEGGWMAEALLASTLIAANGLYKGVLRVRVALTEGVHQAQDAIAAITGRDPGSLDSFGIARAAVESAAENFSDAVVAPVLWYALFGLPGIVAYKTINTLDSMIGHQNERYAAFGRSAALLDDFANWLPARIAGALICIAALITKGANAQAGWHIMRRDAVHHRSPNAGWPEAAMAGALIIAVGGPRRYDGEQTMDPWMGDGNSALSSADIDRAVVIYVRACALLTLLVVGFAAIFAAV